MSRKGMSTRSVHDGDKSLHYEGAINTPIFQSTTFAFPTEEPRTWNGEIPDGTYIYSRDSNPTVRAVEDKLASLEGAESSLAFSSGMAAITSALLTFLQKGDRLVAMQDLYGGTYAFLKNEMSRLGVDVTFVPTTDPAELCAAIDGRTKVLYLESPTNPLLKLIDIRETCRLAHQKGCLVMIDNTFATPILQRPLELGADIVLHSATKYLNGHSDVIAGFVAGSRKDMAMVHLRRKLYGGVLDPLPAYLLGRGMRTLDLRMRKHDSNALAVARFLESHTKVSKCIHPGLASHPDHELANRQMDGYGGMVTFEVKGGRAAAERALKRFKIIAKAASLGGVESLASMPVNTSHTSYSSEERQKLGIGEGMIRLSVGIEDPEDLCQDLDQALN
ncbi:MAG TPA: aminotransferase class I/II-fold pyridoxal phosphate-dependent enzyme [Methanomassiliicoccales archaeon]|nr:aminotransferase class I/II-fold pyridoxal phosphate-dependent enzyme [Methanomassiliicoccales archaeon]HPR97793.1 aminotransferase class I/II-fold pyridoxal phosphate-dependent enzyme [Methanomassiliicoccales archaeon]